MSKQDLSAVKSMRELGLYTPFDVSLWCARHEVQSVYIEHRRRQLMSVEFAVFTQPQWLVLDAAKPGEILYKVVLHHDATMSDARSLAEAWVVVNYALPLTYVPFMKASFSTLGLEMIAQEITDSYKVRIPETGSKQTSTITKDIVMQHLLQEV